MQKSFMRIPYTGPLPPPTIIPSSAGNLSGASEALIKFIRAPSKGGKSGTTLLLSGAGISVASGLADYRGEGGTYTLNRTYRPIYYHEFCNNHEARRRYWARSFLGWTNLHRAKPNRAHTAVKALGEAGFISGVITQNVDSFHPISHPLLPTLELHGYLRSLSCIHCKTELPRDKFQEELSRLNPAWAQFLTKVLNAGALDSENPEERREKGLHTNPDGDVELPDAPYSTFRYPACPRCRKDGPELSDGTQGKVVVDTDGAWLPTSTAGILKPAVVMFGESIPDDIKRRAERMVAGADKLLVVGSSLATYSAWRLAKMARERGMPLGIVNLGGVRGEELLMNSVDLPDMGESGIRCNEKAELLLPKVVAGLTQ